MLAEELKNRYESIAKTEDETCTANDFYLRDLEIKYGLEFIRDRDTVLDVGCGPGVAIGKYASSCQINAHGIDYAENMVEHAKSYLNKTYANLNIQIEQASVTKLPYEDAKFDVVTSHRCLMALLDWELQQKAILEIYRVLKPGGIYVMLEGTFDGLERLNFYRRKFNLTEIEPDGRDRLYTLKFHEKELLDFIYPYFNLIREQRFGMYYFLTRIVQPLFVSPEQPSYAHKLNLIAKQIATLVPDFEKIGHLVGFALRKKK